MNDTTTLESIIVKSGSLNHWEILFVVTLSILIAIANTLMGCELDLNVVVSTVKNPVAPMIGFFTQFVLMPITAYFVAKLILVPRELHAFAIGLFISGCAPPGGASNFWTLLLGGNVHLSVTMTFISMIASIFMIPFWMSILGYQFLENFAKSSVKVPYLNIMSSLLILIVPLLIGILISRKWPNIASKARKALRPFIIFVLLFVITVGIFANFYMIKHINFAAAFSGFLLPLGGFTFGCLTSLLLGQNLKNIIAITIETGVQNTGIAIMILKISFPDADLSILMPPIVACFTALPLLFIYGILSLNKFIENRQTSSIDIGKDFQKSINKMNETSNSLSNEECESFLVRKMADRQQENDRNGKNKQIIVQE